MLSYIVEAVKENIRNPIYTISPIGNLALTSPYTPTIILYPLNTL